ncbi:unnamed protein product [Peronospora belbahrii]|uniref:EF-hand domain-containing protein n=1 Tax=Peronospora belbahrii TaxID=622444 RepID=A0AAU9KTT2_9STRA|nr:unnamed protein product [Peronospora belbahrii]
MPFTQKHPNIKARVRDLFPYDDKQMINMIYHNRMNSLPKGTVKYQLLHEVIGKRDGTISSQVEVYNLFDLDKDGVVLFDSLKMVGWLNYVDSCNPPVSPILVLLQKYGFKEIEMLDHLHADAKLCPAVHRLKR